jgi:hypothetical protein
MTTPPDRFAHDGEHDAQYGDAEDEGLPAGCELFHSVAAELALGSLTGPERSIALSHLDDCGNCRALLEDLSVTADALLLAAPEADPPAGFEVRLLARLGHGEPAAAPAQSTGGRGTVIWLRGRARTVLAAAAAVVAIAGAGIGVGVAVAPRHATQTAAPEIRVGTLQSLATSSAPAASVGEVAIATGDPSFVAMTFRKPGWSGWVYCAVSVNGQTKVLGSFYVRDGSGSWAIPFTSSGAAVSSAQIDGSDGAVFATAHFAS